MKVKELLADESKWTRYAFARDIHGATCDIFNPSAVCFCISGAIARCYYGHGEITPEEIIAKTRHHLRQKGILLSTVDFNDDANTTFEQVKALVEELDI